MMHKGIDLHDLVCERTQRVAEIAALPPEKRTEALLALRAEVEAARGKGMVLGDRQIARELIRARRELREHAKGDDLPFGMGSKIPMERPVTLRIEDDRA